MFLHISIQHQLNCSVARVVDIPKIGQMGKPSYCRMREQSVIMLGYTPRASQLNCAAHSRQSDLDSVSTQVLCVEIGVLAVDGS